MKQELFPFQRQAVWEMRKKAAEALDAYARTRTPQILSLQAPTGSGKTIMMASLIEEILFGTSWTPPGETGFAEQPDAVFVWLSDSPELNNQSKDKIDLGSDRLAYGTTEAIEESSFDREILEDGRIYFLNTQKLSATANLTRKGDRRRWTIWETLENTAREKADRLYFIIDEAHRGMQGKEAGRATSIMQRFLKGYRAAECGMRPMPFVIGMSATAARFNRLAEGLTSTTYKTIVPADRVRASGLLKDRITVCYPEDPERRDDLALLGSATGEWMDKCAHWGQYCREQHVKEVEPVFVIQVKAGVNLNAEAQRRRGNMVRTPLQSRVRVDESLNEVKLFLPYFDADTVAGVIGELKSSECGDIPVDVEGEAVGAGGARAPWSVRPRRRVVYDPRQERFALEAGTTGTTGTNGTVPEVAVVPDVPAVAEAPASYSPAPVQLALPLVLDREAVVRAINSLGLLTYVIRSAQINDYLKSLLDLAGLLTREGIKPEAKGEVDREVTGFIRAYAEGLRAAGRYAALARDVLEFKLGVKVFDAFGNQMERPAQAEFALASESDLDRRLRDADMRLANYGFANKYGRMYATEEDMETYKTDVILYVQEQANMDALYAYAKDRFHALNDECRKYLAQRGEPCRLEYRNIVMNGDKVSEHAFRLGEEVCNYDDAGGKRYADHLYADDEGIATIRLNTWEEGVIEEEEKRRDFVCWLRNTPSASWALRLPYESNGETRPMFPDFLVVRRDSRTESGFVFDLLEPHNPNLADNLAKAKGLARYAEREVRFGRIQLIRKFKGLSGKDTFRRLDFCKGEVREKVLHAVTLEDLDNLFASDGVVEGSDGV